MTVQGVCLTATGRNAAAPWIARAQNYEAMTGIRLAPEVRLWARCGNRDCVAANHAEVRELGR